MNEVNLPRNWARVELQDITMLNPRDPKPDCDASSLVHFVPMSAVCAEFGGVDVSTLRPLREVQKGYTSFIARDVLFAKITPCMENGKCALVPTLPNAVAFGSTEFHVLRGEDGIDPRWLAYFVSQADFRRFARQHMTGSAGQMRVSATWLACISMPIAPVAEQTRIIEKIEELLSDLDTGVAELKAAQKKMLHYRQSLLKAAMGGALTVSWRAQMDFPGIGEDGTALLQRILRERRARWEVKQLARFQQQGKTPPKSWQAKYPEPAISDTSTMPVLPPGWVWASIDQLSPDDLANGRSVVTAEVGAKVLRLTAVKDGRIDLAECKVGAWSAEDAQPFAVADGDLLIVRGNGSLSLVGRAGMVSSVSEQIAYPDTMIRLRTLDSIVRAKWVGLMWNAASTRTHLERRARTSAGIYKISQPDIVSVMIPVPPLDEQDQILSALELDGENLRVIQAMLKQGVSEAVAQRKNILKAAFSGQLVPQDPRDEPASALLERILKVRAERESQPRERRTRARKIAA